MTRRIRELTALGITIMGWFFAFCSFIPIFVLQSEFTQQGDISDLSIPTDVTSLNATATGDDYYYINGFDEQPIVREATISAIMISIPLILDVFLDMLPPWVNALLFAETRQLSVLSMKKSELTLFHLTVLEKVSFIIGTVCLSALSFEPVRSYRTPEILNLSFLNANTCLVACPILAFLVRCAPTWTPIRCATIAFLICAGALLSSFSYLPTPSEEISMNIFSASEITVTIAFGLYILMCFISAINTIWFHVPYPDDPEINRPSNATSDSNSVQDLKKKSTNRFRNCVIASHIATTFIIAVVNPVWFFETGNLSSVDYSVIIYTLVIASSIVYVTEFRVRKSEVTTALVSAYFLIYNMRACI